MSVKKLIAIITIYVFTCVAWMILGVSNLSRTEKSFRSLKSEVISLYGDALIIKAPECYSKTQRYKEEIIEGKKVSEEYFDKDDYELSKSDIEIKINLDQRKKGIYGFLLSKQNLVHNMNLKSKMFKKIKIVNTIYTLL